jgi:hypothetical protein
MLNALKLQIKLQASLLGRILFQILPNCSSLKWMQLGLPVEKSA